MQLTYSVYHIKPTPSKGPGGYLAKLTAVCLPVVQVAMMRTGALQSNLVAFYFVANVISTLPQAGLPRKGCA